MRRYLRRGARLAAQGEGARRRAAAGRVIDNSGDRAALEARVGELAAELRRLAAAPRAPGARGAGDAP